MKYLFLGFGILMVSFAYEESPIFGGMLLAIVVLGILISAQKRGVII